MHGKRRQAPPNHSSHSAAQSLGRPPRPGLRLRRRPRYFRPQQRLRHCAVCSGSEPDIEATDEIGDIAPVSASGRHGASASWSESYSRQQERLHQEHLRSRSLPLPLPQYQPPLPISRAGRAHGEVAVARAPAASNLGAIAYGSSAYAMQRYSPETQQRLSIQSVLSPEEPSSPGAGPSHCEATNYDRDGQNRRFR